ncbi:hypothetical protein D3C73_1350280 [compost metagenome]
MAIAVKRNFHSVINQLGINQSCLGTVQLVHELNVVQSDGGGVLEGDGILHLIALHDISLGRCCLGGSLLHTGNGFRKRCGRIAVRLLRLD